jgi:hypothetical protein
MEAVTPPLTMGVSQTTLSTTIREALPLPITGAPAMVPKAQEGFSMTAIRETNGTPGLGPDVREFLDELCKGVKGLDKYSAITKDTIEEKDGMFLSGTFESLSPLVLIKFLG